MFLIILYVYLTHNFAHHNLAGRKWLWRLKTEQWSLMINFWG